MKRGGDFAYQLSETERQTLDLLLSDLAVRGVPRRRPGWSRATLAGFTVAALLLVAATLPRLGSSPPAPAANVYGIDVLTRLSMASANQSGSSTQDATTVVARQDGQRCVASGMRVAATLVGSRALEVTVQSVAVSPLARQRLTCPMASVLDLATPTQRLSRQTLTADAGWSPVRELADQLGVVPPDPRRLAGMVDVAYLNAHLGSVAPVLDKLTLVAGGDRAAAWWRLSTELIASVLATPDLRATVLALAAADATLTAKLRLVSRDQPDLLGRPGWTIQVPYQVDGHAGMAELGFAGATGALRQLVVYPVPGRAWQMIITTYTST